MTDPINQRYGITDEAVAAEVARILPAMEAWAEEDAKRHPHTPLTPAEVVARRVRGVEAKASAAIEDMLPTVETEAMFAAFDALAWDADRCGRWIDQAARDGSLPAPT